MLSFATPVLCFALAACAQAPAGETVLLDFTADWCGPCQQVRPVIQQLERAGAPVRVVNIDRERDLAAKYRVTSIPCLVMVVNGQEVDRTVGMPSNQWLMKMMAMADSAGPRGGPARALAQSPDSGQPSLSASAPALTPPGAAVGSTIPSRPSTSPLMASGGAGPLGLVPPGAGPAANSGGVNNAVYNAPVERNASPAASRLDGNAAERKLLSAAVRLKVEDARGNSFGSGTIIDGRDEEALVLTCGHIFRDSEGKGKITVDIFTPQGTKTVEGRLITFDLTRDLGFVCFRPGMEFSVAKIASKNFRLQQGSRVVSVGCDHGADPSVRASYVTGIDKINGPPNTEVAVAPVEGRSGGGLFNEAGQLVGVCNAADPMANVGVYAGLASIQAELERIGLLDICATDSGDDDAFANAIPVNNPPAMASGFPNGGAPPVAATPAAFNSPAAATRAAVTENLTPSEKAALAEIVRRGQSAEVICIVRPIGDTEGKSDVIVLDRTSPAFVEQLSQMGKGRPHFTSMEVPHTAQQPASDNSQWRGTQR